MIIRKDEFGVNVHFTDSPNVSIRYNYEEWNQLKTYFITEFLNEEWAESPMEVGLWIGKKLKELEEEN